VAPDRAILAEALRDGPAARVVNARDRQRDILRDAGGLPVAADAERLPPWETTYRWFAAWRYDGRFERINHALVMADREGVGRDASASAAIIDSQSVKTIEAGGPRGSENVRQRVDGPCRITLGILFHQLSPLRPFDRP
jgi:transposase